AVPGTRLDLYGPSLNEHGAGSSEREVEVTGLVESASATEDSAFGELTAAAEPSPPISSGPRSIGWHVIGWFACGLAGATAITWFVFSTAKADWFFGAVVCCAVLVSMWQTVTIGRQANHHAAEAADRLRTELVVAEQRAARELAMTQALHRVEMEAR